MAADVDVLQSDDDISDDDDAFEPTQPAPRRR